LTEHRLTERRLPKVHFISENGHLTEYTFNKKCHLAEKKLRNGRLTKNLFERKII
jgi:hypothetical protein